MTADYVIPACPGDDPGADEMGWDSTTTPPWPTSWCPNHPGSPTARAVCGKLSCSSSGPTAVPLTLTPKTRRTRGRGGAARRRPPAGRRMGVRSLRGRLLRHPARRRPVPRCRDAL